MIVLNHDSASGGEHSILDDGVQGFFCLIAGIRRVKQDDVKRRFELRNLPEPARHLELHEPPRLPGELDRQALQVVADAHDRFSVRLDKCDECRAA